MRRKYLVSLTEGQQAYGSSVGWVGQKTAFREHAARILHRFSMAFNIQVSRNTY